jgi:hypothetical protein
MTQNREGFETWSIHLNHATPRFDQLPLLAGKHPNTNTKGPQFNWEPLVKEAAFVFFTPEAQRLLQVTYFSLLTSDEVFDFLTALGVVVLNWWTLHEVA